MTAEAGRRDAERGGRPTIHDVAALSGVSKSTVSNVTRGVATVAPATRERVLEAIERLGYRPNALARNLVQHRTNVIGVVVGDLANTFYAELVKLMEQEASQFDYTTMVCNTEGHPEWEKSRINALLEQRVGGLAMLQFSGDRTVLSQLIGERTPTVMVSCWADLADSVAVDDHAGMGLAVDHLVGLGHRRIAHMADATMEPATRQARLDGQARALARHGLVSGASRTWNAGDPAESEELARALDGAEPPTAIVAANDFTAIRAIEALESLGREVPRDVSVTGFDGIALGALSRVSLTTVAQPKERLASSGVRLLLDRITQGYEAPLRRERLKPSLVVRGSTAPPAP